MSHRFLLRLITNMAVFLLSLFCLGVVLWVIDEFLRWDILPESWSLVVRGLLVAGGIVTVALGVMNLLLSLALVAESSASRAGLPDYGVSQRLKRRVRRTIALGMFAIALLIGGLQITHHLRAQAADRAAEVTFNQEQADLEQAMPEVLNLFSDDILAGLETDTLPQKGQLGNLAKLFKAIQSSFPHSPNIALITPVSSPPFKYRRIDASSITSNGTGKIMLDPKLYVTFPNPQEEQAISQLLAGELPAIAAPLKGEILNNTRPSTWGVLKREGRVIAIAYLQVGDLYGTPYPPYPDANDEPSFHHNGPEQLLTNAQ